MAAGKGVMGGGTGLCSGGSREVAATEGVWRKGARPGPVAFGAFRGLGRGWTGRGHSEQSRGAISNAALQNSPAEPGEEP